MTTPLLPHLEKLLAAASPLPWESELDSFTEEEGIVATFANRGELLGKIETGIMLHRSDGPDWTAADDAARDAVWARARAGQEIKDADLLVAAVNALPALIRLARAAEAWRDRVYPNSPTSTSDGVRICDSGIVAAVDALRQLAEVT